MCYLPYLVTLHDSRSQELELPYLTLPYLKQARAARAARFCRWQSWKTSFKPRYMYPRSTPRESSFPSHLDEPDLRPLSNLHSFDEPTWTHGFPHAIRRVRDCVITVESRYLICS